MTDVSDGELRVEDARNDSRDENVAPMSIGDHEEGPVLKVLETPQSVASPELPDDPTNSNNPSSAASDAADKESAETAVKPLPAPETAVKPVSVVPKTSMSFASRDGYRYVQRGDVSFEHKIEYSPDGKMIPCKFYSDTGERLFSIDEVMRRWNDEVSEERERRMKQHIETQEMEHTAEITTNIEDAIIPPQSDAATHTLAQEGVPSRRRHSSQDHPEEPQHAEPRPAQPAHEPPNSRPVSVATANGTTQTMPEPPTSSQESVLSSAGNQQVNCLESVPSGASNQPTTRQDSVPSSAGNPPASRQEPAANQPTRYDANPPSVFLNPKREIDDDPEIIVVADRSPTVSGFYGEPQPRRRISYPVATPLAGTPLPPPLQSPYAMPGMGNASVVFVMPDGRRVMTCVMPPETGQFPSMTGPFPVPHLPYPLDPHVGTRIIDYRTNLSYDVSPAGHVAGVQIVPSPMAGMAAGAYALRPHATPHYRSDATPQYRPDATPQYRPDATPQFRPDATPQYRPDATPQYRPDATPQYRPEVVDILDSPPAASNPRQYDDDAPVFVTPSCDFLSAARCGSVSTAASEATTARSRPVPGASPAISGSERRKTGIADFDAVLAAVERVAKPSRTTEEVILLDNSPVQQTNRENMSALVAERTLTGARTQPREQAQPRPIANIRLPLTTTTSTNVAPASVPSVAGPPPSTPIPAPRIPSTRKQQPQEQQLTKLLQAQKPKELPKPPVEAPKSVPILPKIVPPPAPAIMPTPTILPTPARNPADQLPLIVKSSPIGSPLSARHHPNILHHLQSNGDPEPARAKPASQPVAGGIRPAPEPPAILPRPVAKTEPTATSKKPIAEATITRKNAVVEPIVATIKPVKQPTPAQNKPVASSNPPTDKPRPGGSGEKPVYSRRSGGETKEDQEKIMALLKNYKSSTEQEKLNKGNGEGKKAEYTTGSRTAYYAALKKKLYEEPNPAAVGMKSPPAPRVPSTTTAAAAVPALENAEKQPEAARLEPVRKSDTLIARQQFQMEIARKFSKKQKERAAAKGRGEHDDDQPEEFYSAFDFVNAGMRSCIDHHELSGDMKAVMVDFYEELRACKSPASREYLSKCLQDPMINGSVSEVSPPYALLGIENGLFVPILDNKNEIRESVPRDRNWKMLHPGSIVWGKFGNEWWPASIAGFIRYERLPNSTCGDVVVVKWFNDDRRSYLHYAHVIHFDLAFHICLQRNNRKQSYCKTVAEAIVSLGRLGYWEPLVNSVIGRYLRQLKMPCVCMRKDTFEMIMTEGDANIKYPTPRTHHQHNHIEHELLMFFKSMAKVDIRSVGMRRNREMKLKDLDYDECLTILRGGQVQQSSSTTTTGQAEPRRARANKEENRRSAAEKKSRRTAVDGGPETAPEPAVPAKRSRPAAQANV